MIAILTGVRCNLNAVLIPFFPEAKDVELSAHLLPIYASLFLKGRGKLVAGSCKDLEYICTYLHVELVLSFHQAIKISPLAWQQAPLPAEPFHWLHPLRTVYPFC